MTRSSCNMSRHCPNTVGLRSHGTNTMITLTFRPVSLLLLLLLLWVG
jgi:hypothetical protein